MQQHARLIPAIFLTAVLVGCEPAQPPATNNLRWNLPKEAPVPDDPSITLLPDSSELRKGTIYDKAVLNVDATQTIVVPNSAIVEHGAQARRVELYLAKQMVDESDDHIRELRTTMGCVKRMEQGKLVLGVYGEWGMMESAAGMRVLLIRVPNGQPVETRAGLSGTVGVKGVHRLSRSTREPGEDGWETIPSEPDPKRTAGKYQDK
jgi:hypothetical protein